MMQVCLLSYRQTGGSQSGSVSSVYYLSTQLVITNLAFLSSEVKHRVQCLLWFDSELDQATTDHAASSRFGRTSLSNKFSRILVVALRREFLALHADRACTRYVSEIMYGYSRFCPGNLLPVIYVVHPCLLWPWDTERCRDHVLKILDAFLSLTYYTL